MSIVDILWGTPAWVYVIFVYLLMVGIKSLQPSNVPLQRLVIVPIIFIAWSFYSLKSKYGLCPTVFGLWGLAFTVGIFIGWSIFYHGIKVNKKSMLVHLPGSWYPLVMYMIFFGLKYCLGVMYATAPELRAHILFWLTDATASGLISGIFGGRFLHIMRQYSYR